MSVNPVRSQMIQSYPFTRFLTCESHTPQYVTKWESNSGKSTEVEVKDKERTEKIVSEIVADEGRHQEKDADGVRPAFLATKLRSLVDSIDSVVASYNDQSM